MYIHIILVKWLASSNETVNKPENIYDFVKLVNLKIEQEYEITFFEFIITKYVEKLTVLLNIKLKLILPNTHIKKN